MLSVRSEFFLISFFLLIPASLHAQPEVTDSLKKLLRTTHSDTTEIRLLNEIAEFSEDSDIIFYSSMARSGIMQLGESFREKNKRFFYHQLAASCYWTSNYYNYKEQTDSGRKYLNLTLKYALEINDDRFIAMAYGDFGVLAVNKGPDSAIAWISKSIPYAHRSGDSSQIATIHNNLGHLYRAKGDFLTAIEHLFIGLKIDMRLGNTEDVGTEYNNIGTTFYDLGMMEEALDNYKKSYAIAIAGGDPKTIANRLTNLGGAYEKLNLLDSALVYYEQGLFMRETSKKKGIGGSYGHIASVFKKKGQYDKANNYFHKSIYYNRVEGDSFKMASSQLNLGTVYLLQKNIDSAEWYLLTAYNYMKRNGGLQDVRDASYYLSKVYGDKKNFQKAYLYAEEYIRAKDSVDNKQIKRNTLSKQFEFEYEKKEAVAKAEQDKKDAVTALHLRNQKIMRNVFIGALLIALLISALLYNRYRLKQKTSQQLEEKNKIIEKEKQRAEESEKFKSQFLANMSHEIRTPMNAISGFTNLLFDVENDDKRMQYLNAIKKSSDNLLVVVNDVLELSKLEAGKMELERTPFRLREVVNFVYQTFELQASENNIRWNINVSKNVPAILTGDASRLTQVLMNLVANAMKFTSKGFVELSVTCIMDSEEIDGENSKEASGCRLQFKITDTGIGIADSQVEKIFGNFIQVDGNKRKYGGTGLGLTISKSLVELMQGSLEVRSEIGKGSEFSFSVPFEIASEEQWQQYQKEALIYEEDLGEELRGISILVAEDNEYNQLLLADTLHKFIPDLKLEIFSNGKDLLQRLPDSDFDLILMDIQMPEMDGYETTREIRNQKSEVIHNIPIIALTASVIRTDIDKCIEAGMNSYVTKPFSTKELLLSMTKVLGKNVDKSMIIEEEIIPVVNPKHQWIRLNHLHQLVSGDAVQITRYLTMFTELIPQRIIILEKALEEEDYVLVRKTVHAMKPQLASLGLQASKKLAESIESNFHREDRIPDDAKELIHECSGALQEVRKELGVI